eukprot:CAMPEP_0172644010 /NCGR_PEP_ID=MMETSP1068-20121228/238987_1 /TAXON_ID=35684 /ORGANISM="Pseudopedinella elastica, Strain CCMP716" /LENGTH=1130 /DNA_ID=CAMNT_0013458191 /DNA_START=782 /DNA_END=4171 /DNA_ORIENTATION=-
MELVVDYVNTERCGVSFGGNKYSIDLVSMDDSSSSSVIKNVYNYSKEISPAPALYLGPYSSGLTGALAPLTQANSQLLIAPGAASTSVFAGRDKAFGLFVKSSSYMETSMSMLGAAGAKTVAVMFEDASFTRGVCAAVPSLAQNNNMMIVNYTQIPAAPTQDEMENVAEHYKDINPDVVVACLYDAGCGEWVRAQRAKGWSAKAEVLTVCVGSQAFIDDVGSDANYFMTPTPWHQTLDVTDTVTGWKPMDFANKYQTVTSEIPTYHGAAGGGSVSLAVAAIEAANSLSPTALSTRIAAGGIDTLYGSLSFDSNGQNSAGALVLQNDAKGHVQIVYPPSFATGQLIYPMPGWLERDCLNGKNCSGHGTCNSDGSCLCNTGFKASGDSCLFNQCPAGSATAQDSSSGELCVTCTPGKYTVTAGQQFCQNCGMESYSDSSGAITCKTCPDHSRRIFDITNEDSILGTSRDQCTCKEGTVKNEDGVCLRCPSLATCLSGTTIPTLDIERGAWRVSNTSMDVLECPIEVACPGGPGASTQCNEGYQGILCASCEQNYFYHKDSNSCKVCGEPSIQSAAERVRASVVLSILFFLLMISFGGFLVTRFAPGLVQGPALDKLNAFSGWLLKLRKKSKMKLKCLMSFAQISANIAFNCSINFPPSVETMSNVFSIANIEIVPALGIPCWLKQFDYIDTMMSYTLGPIFVMVAIMGIFVINNSDTLFSLKNDEAAVVATSKFTKAQLKEMYLLPDEVEACFTRFELKGIRKTFAFFDRNGGGSIDVEETYDLVKTLIEREITLEDVRVMFKEAKGLGPKDEMENEEIDFRAFVDMTQRAREKDELVALSLLADEVEAEASRSNASGYIYAILFLSFLALPGTTTCIINFFKCREFKMPEGSTESYLYNDYTISCNSDQYKSYVGYAVFMIFVYPIGIPLIWSVMLYRSRHILKDVRAMKREAMFGEPRVGHLSFLVESYLPKFYYFEVLECVRRILLTSAISLADEDSAIAPIAGIIISLVFVFIFSELKPFKEPETSALGIILMYTITVIFLAALIVKSNTVSNDDPVFGALLMFTIFGGLTLGLAISIYGTDPFNATAKRVAAEKAAQLAALRTKVNSMWQVINGGSNKGEIERLACW